MLNMMNFELTSKISVESRMLLNCAKYNLEYIFYSWVMYLLTVIITEAFGLPKLILFSNYKVMLLLCHFRVM